MCIILKEENDIVIGVYQKINNFLKSHLDKKLIVEIVVERGFFSVQKQYVYECITLNDYSMTTYGGLPRPIVRDKKRPFVGLEVTKMYSLEELINNDKEKLKSIISSNPKILKDVPELVGII